MLQEGPQHVPDWEFDLPRPVEDLLQRVHLLEIQLPVVIAPRILQLQDDSIYLHMYLSMCSNSLSFSFFPSARSLNSFTLLNKAAGFFMSLYSIRLEEGVHFREPKFAYFFCYYPLRRGAFLEFWIRNLRICSMYPLVNPSRLQYLSAA